MSPDLLPDLFEAQKKLGPALKRRLACPDHSNITALVGCEIGDPALTGPQLARREGASIRAVAPLRLGLAGGGTDVSPYCDEYGGAILNATIGRYAYAHLGFRDDHRICFSAHDVEQDDVAPLAAELPLDSGLRLHRAVYNRLYVTSCAVGFTQFRFRRRSMRHPPRDWAHHPRLSLPWSRLIVPHLAYHLGGMTLLAWPLRSSASTSISPAVDRTSMLLPSAE